MKLSRAENMGDRLDFGTSGQNGQRGQNGQSGKKINASHELKILGFKSIISVIIQLYKAGVISFKTGVRLPYKLELSLFMIVMSRVFFSAHVALFSLGLGFG